MDGARSDGPTRSSAVAISRRDVIIGVAAGAAGAFVARGRHAGALAAGAWPVAVEEDGMESIRTDDGVNLAYRTHGEGSLNLLFMHGWAGSGAFFDETIKYLDLTGLRAITYDLRGHGASDKPETGYTLDRFALDAFAVADAAGAGEVVVVGYSMSGKFSQYMALVEPDRVRGQIMVSGWPAGTIPFPAETQADWVGRAGDRERLEELERQFLTQKVPDAVLDAWLDDAVKVPRFVLDETLTMAVAPSFADRLGEIETPTLVVGGLHDPVATPDFLRQFVVAPLAHAGARLVLADCNHDVPIELPRQMAGLIEAFIAAAR